WSEASRYPRRAADQVRPPHQSDDRQGARPRSAANAPRARRRGDRMRRRDFITLLGGATPWPLAVRAEQGEQVRRAGGLMPLAQDNPVGPPRIAALLQQLRQLGWIAGRNVEIDVRWTGPSAESIRKHAAELAALAPDVILANGSVVVAQLLQATRTVPVVFV